MGIKEFLERMKARKELIRQYTDQDKIVTTLQERKKSANERELERYMKEAREKRVKEQLEKFRKQKANEIWHKDVVTQKPIFNKGGCMLKWK